jgi:hypothetical protein
MAGIPEKFVSVQKVLWGAITGTTVLLLTVAVLLDPTTNQPDPMLVPLLGMLALTSGGMSVFLPRQITRQQLRARGIPTRVRSPDERMFADGPQTRERVIEDDAAVQRAVAPLQSGFVLGIALAESVALFGFVVLFLGNPLLLGLPFFVVSWALLLSKFPSKSRMEQTLRDSLDADLP